MNETAKSAHTLRTIDELATAGFVAPSAVPDLARVARRYAVAITPDMAALIDREDTTDPIARQFVPEPGRTRIQAR